jgi:Flp pilus assembly protein protease CpaA
MKLMAAVGAMVGPYGALVSALMAVVLGGLYAFAAMSLQWGITGTARKLVLAVRLSLRSGAQAWTQELSLPFRLRYGLAIAGGTLLFLGGLHPFGG